MDHRAVTAMVAALAPVIHEHVTKGIADAVAPLLKRINELEARAPEKGEPGDCGADGAPGRDGIDGKDADPVTSDQILKALCVDPSLIQEAVDAWLAENPPQPGKDGAPGQDGEKGDAGPAGRDGIDGKDGPAGRDGQPGVPGRDGKDGAAGAAGKDGADGLGFDDLSVKHDGERTLTLRFARGDQSKEFAIDLPVVIDRGVWREGAFKRGDGVSWGGSFFIAQRDTTAKPETSPDWRLAVKRGRDGRDGKAGEPGQKGDKGDRGEPGPRGYGG